MTVTRNQIKLGWKDDSGVNCASCKNEERSTHQRKKHTKTFFDGVCDTNAASCKYCEI